MSDFGEAYRMLEEAKFNEVAVALVAEVRDHEGLIDLLFSTPRSEDQPVN
ncbi:hypothetical protein M3484_16390 [Pseudomonas sp. GX19020]|nr:hypothetical protein [Pseudomonas sp. GX19020]MCL4068151.1 hypothetical protein [Pseudomonas sp. GX19020]